MKQGKFTTQERREILEKLLSMISYIELDNAKIIIQNIIKSFNPISDNELHGYISTFELLPSLIHITGNIYRNDIINRICDTIWPTCMIVTLSSLLVELCETEIECKQCIFKISSYVRLDINTFIGNYRSTNKGFYSGHSRVVQPDELPALIYQLISISRKCENNCAPLKALVLETTCNILDSLLLQSTHMDTSYHNISQPFEIHSNKHNMNNVNYNHCFHKIFQFHSNNTNNNNIMIQDDNNSSNNIMTNYSADEYIMCNTRLDAVFATIIHHLSLLISKDQVITAHILYNIYYYSYVEQYSFCINCML
jgi:hypothetical protein